LTGGRYSEVAVRTGLTVLSIFENKKIRKMLKNAFPTKKKIRAIKMQIEIEKK
jgi:hypothetical protein